ncbi:hypothetical protein BDR07DRAFT_1412773 [Suillus spraguei]|nr:hypothetical protein BDR07DRAFT_1412773 [Suillus spraguei]
MLEQLKAPRFANCRLHLPCISFRVTEVRRRRGLAQETLIMYGIKANGLQDLLITTEDTLPIQHQQTFLLVPDFAEHAGFTDDVESMGDWNEPGYPAVCLLKRRLLHERCG